MKAGELFPILDRISTEMGVPTSVTRSIFAAENSGSGRLTADSEIDPKAVSSAGAKGPMQVVDATWEGLKKQGVLPANADRNNIEHNIRAGVAVIKERLAARKGNTAAAAADYNGGIAAGNAVVAGKQPPTTETQDYLRKTGMATTTSRYGFTDTTKTPGIPKEVALDSYNKFISDNAMLRDELQRAVAGSTAVASDVVRSVSDAGAIGAAATAAAGEVNAAQADKANSVADLIGASTGNADSRIVRSIAEREKLYSSMDTLRGEITAQDSVSILEDPLQYLANKLVHVPQMKRTYNDIAARATQLDDRIATVNRDAAASQAVNTAASGNDIRRAASLKAATITADAAVKANEARQQVMTMSAQSILQQMASSGAGFDKLMQVGRLFAESHSMSMADTQIDKQSASDRRLQGTVDVINTKKAAVGAPLISLDQFKQLNASSRDFLESNSQVANIGRDPGDTWLYLHSQGVLGSVGDKHPVLANFLQQRLEEPAVATELETLRKDPRASKMPEEELQAAALKKAAANGWKQISGPDRNHSILPKTSPYFFNKLNAATSPELKNNWVAQSLSKRTQLDPSIILRGVEDKDLLQEALGKAMAFKETGTGADLKTIAAQLADFYTKGQLSQWKEGGAMIAGYPKPVDYVVRGYKTKSTGRALQMWSPVEIEHWLISNATQQQGFTGQLWDSASGAFTGN